MFEERRDRGWVRLSMLGALVALITVFAVACGNDDDGDGDGGNGSEPTAAATTGGGDEGDSITIEAGQPIKIGISTTLTTDNAELGFPIRDGSLLAIKEKGTIKGFTVEGVAEDDLCDGPGSVTAAEKLISEDVVAVLGPMCSGGAVAAIPVYQEENLVTVSGSATGVAVTQQGSDSFFRTAWNDATQGAEMAKYAYETLGERTAVLVNDQSVYGQGLMTVFKDSWEELGGEIVSEEAVTVGEKDFSPVVTKISNDQPDIVVFGGFIAEGAVLVSQLKDAGVESTFMGADGVADQDFIDQSQGKAEGAARRRRTTRCTSRSGWPSRPSMASRQGSSPSTTTTRPTSSWRRSKRSARWTQTATSSSTNRISSKRSAAPTMPVPRVRSSSTTSATASLRRVSSTGLTR